MLAWVIGQNSLLSPSQRLTRMWNMALLIQFTLLDILSIGLRQEPKNPVQPFGEKVR